MGSPWEPVEMTQTRRGSRSPTFSMSTRLSSRIWRRPIERARATFLAIDRPSGGDGSAAGDGGVGDLLDAVDVAGEAGHDDPLVGVGREQVAAGRRRPTRSLDGVPFLLGVGRVRQQQPDAGSVANGADPGQVGRAAVDGRQVELEVPGVEDDPLGGVEGGGEAVGHRVGDRDELHVERTDLAAFAVADRDELGPAEQAGLLDAVAGQAEGELRAVDRYLDAHGAGS